MEIIVIYFISCIYIFYSCIALDDFSMFEVLWLFFSMIFLSIIYGLYLLIVYSNIHTLNTINPFRYLHSFLVTHLTYKTLIFLIYFFYFCLFIFFTYLFPQDRKIYQWASMTEIIPLIVPMWFYWPIFLIFPFLYIFFFVTRITIYRRLNISSLHETYKKIVFIDMFVMIFLGIIIIYVYFLIL